MRPYKKQLVQDIRDFLEPSPSAFLITYKGLTVADFAELRAELDEKGAACHVVPNRLLRIAAEEAGQDALQELPLQGDTALVAGGDDPAVVAKVLATFKKEHDALTFKAGIVDGALYNAADVETLATLPPTEVLQAQLVGLLQAPMRQLASVLNAKVASVVYALQAYVDKQQNQS